MSTSMVLLSFTVFMLLTACDARIRHPRSEEAYDCDPNADISDNGKCECDGISFCQHSSYRPGERCIVCSFTQVLSNNKEAQEEFHDDPNLPARHRGKILPGSPGTA